MTEKRFERIYSDVDVFCRDHNAKGISQLIEKEDYDKIVDLLNELNNEVKSQSLVIKGYQERTEKLFNENEQLKQFQEKVFVLLNEKIKHYEHKPFSAPISQPMSVNFDADMDRLARLSELQEFRKELKE